MGKASRGKWETRMYAAWLAGQQSAETEPMANPLLWVLQKLWSWPVVGAGASVVYGLGAAALFGDEYIAAAVLFCLGVIWVAAKTLAWEETAKHARRGTVSTIIIILAAAAIGGSLSWVWYRHSSSSEMSAEEVGEMTELDDIFAGKDESQLRSYFGFPEMIQVNISVNKERLLHFQKTGDPNIDITPYISHMQAQYSTQFTTRTFLRTPGPISIPPLDIHAVSLLFLPNAYTAHKAELQKLENSTALPASVAYGIKDFDRTLQENVDLLQNTLNVAIREDPRYFLLNDDMSQPRFYDALQTRYLDDFNQLRPLADQIRDHMREARKTN